MYSQSSVLNLTVMFGTTFRYRGGPFLVCTILLVLLRGALHLVLLTASQGDFGSTRSLFLRTIEQSEGTRSEEVGRRMDADVMQNKITRTDLQQIFGLCYKHTTSEDERKSNRGGKVMNYNLHTEIIFWSRKLK
jgi:hypothetical protein